MKLRGTNFGLLKSFIYEILMVKNYAKKVDKSPNQQFSIPTKYFCK